LRIAVTGGIGSGKSTFCGFLEALGFRHLNADEIAHSLLEEEGVREAVLRRFGTLERPKIAEAVFREDESYRWLCDLLHPRVLEFLLREISSLRPEEDVVVEIPLLFEVGVPGWVDMTVFVRTRREVALNRLSSRGWSEAEVERRERHLLPEDRKAKLSDLVVSNDGDLQALKEKAERLARRASLWRQVVDFEATFASASEAGAFIEEATRSRLAAFGRLETCFALDPDPLAGKREAFRAVLRSVSLNSGELVRLAERVGSPRGLSWTKLCGGSWRHLEEVCLLCGLLEGPLPQEL